MIIEVTGDILLSSAHAIAHGVAPNDPVHSGLALSLREKWPSMYKDFRHYGQTTHPHQGTIWAWAGAGEGAHGTVRIIGGAGQIQRGDNEQGKMSIISGALIAAAPLIMRILFEIFFNSSAALF